MTPETITVRGMNFTYGEYVFACVLVAIENLKAKGIIESRWKANAEVLREVKAAGEAVGWPEPTRFQIFAVLDELERQARLKLAELN